MRKTLSACRCVSTSPMYTSTGIPSAAPTIAVATPCWPAPVSAISRFLPICCASSACPRVLFSLWEPPCTRSSRLRYILHPSFPDAFGQKVRGVSRPAYSACSPARIRANCGSVLALAYALSSSISAPMRDSETYCPPYLPYLPRVVTLCPPCCRNECGNFFIFFDTWCRFDTACDIHCIRMYLPDGILYVFRGQTSSENDRFL